MSIVFDIQDYWHLPAERFSLTTTHYTPNNQFLRRPSALIFTEYALLWLKYSDKPVRGSMNYGKVEIKCTKIISF